MSSSYFQSSRGMCPLRANLAASRCGAASGRSYHPGPHSRSGKERGRTLEGERPFPDPVPGLPARGSPLVVHSEKMVTHPHIAPDARCSRGASSPLRSRPSPARCRFRSRNQGSRSTGRFEEPPAAPIGPGCHARIRCRIIDVARRRPYPSCRQGVLRPG
jgi:hypothetical protein